MEKTEKPQEEMIFEEDRDENLSVVPQPAAATRTPQSEYLTYLAIPALFLVVTLLGGLRFAAADGAFVFLKPALIALVFSALTMLLYFRSGFLRLTGWADQRSPAIRTAANIAVLLTVFTATTQLYNSLLPEQGLPFWIIGFCFLWTLWTSISIDLDAKRTLKSLSGSFALAFAVKYLVLANLTAAPAGSWWQRLFENPGKEAFTWLLDLPAYSPATGYVQFLVLVLYLIGLIMMPPSVTEERTSSTARLALRSQHRSED